MPNLDTEAPTEDEESTAVETLNRPSKYVPPSQRGNASGESSFNRNDSDRDTATLRVTNISPDTKESDLQDLFRPFGPISRIFLV